GRPTTICWPEDGCCSVGASAALPASRSADLREDHAMTRWADGLEEEARQLLPAPVHRYYSQGSADEFTVGEAVAAWKALRFRPRILVDVSGVDVATSALGVGLPSPIAIAPSSLQMHGHPEGEVEMGRGAAAAGT